MTNPTLKQPRTWLVSAALLLTLAGVFVGRTAFARIARNTIDPLGIVADRGRQVTVTGPIAVTAGERTELRVTVTRHFRLGRPRWSDWRAAALADRPPMRISGW